LGVDTANGGWNSERKNKTCASKKKRITYSTTNPDPLKAVPPSSKSGDFAQRVTLRSGFLILCKTNEIDIVLTILLKYYARIVN
jgi:hypothetical protein